ncbi:hypothetical protein ACQKWADRAFT_293996 [Trichoderma austrokoningii]
MVQGVTDASSSSSNIQSLKLGGVGSWQSGVAPPLPQSIDDPELITRQLSYSSCQTCLYPSFFGNDLQHSICCGDFDELFYNGFDDADWKDPPTSQLDCEASIYGVSQEQLIAEVKGLYADLDVVQVQCYQIEMFKHHPMPSAYEDFLIQEQWEAMVTCLREILRGHHQSFLRSPLPPANSALVRVLSKHVMPLRLWVHGTYNPFNGAQDEMPPDLKHMLSLISLAYSMAGLMNDIEKRAYQHQTTLLEWLKRTASILNRLLERFQQRRPKLVIGALAFICQFSGVMRIWTMYWIRHWEHASYPFTHQRGQISYAEGHSFQDTTLIGSSLSTTATLVQSGVNQHILSIDTPGIIAGESHGTIDPDLLPPGRCPLCAKTFSRSDSLKRHLIEVHTAGSAPSFPCRHRGCKKFKNPFKRSIKLLNHLQKSCKFESQLRGAASPG